MTNHAHIPIDPANQIAYPSITNAWIGERFAMPDTHRTLLHIALGTAGFLLILLGIFLFERIFDVPNPLPWKLVLFVLGWFLVAFSFSPSSERVRPQYFFVEAEPEYRIERLKMLAALFLLSFIFVVRKELPTRVTYVLIAATVIAHSLSAALTYPKWRRRGWSRRECLVLLDRPLYVFCVALGAISVLEVHIIVSIVWIPVAVFLITQWQNWLKHRYATVPAEIRGTI